MRKFNKFLYVLAALSFVAVACEEEEAIEPGEQEVENCYGVFFPAQEASGSHVFSPTEEAKVVVKLARTNTEGAITVPIVATYSEDGIFTASEATFADGQDATTFTVTFPNAKEGSVYDAHFLIEDPLYASLYSKNPVGLDFSVMRVETKTFSGNNEDGSPCKITFTVENMFQGDLVGFEADNYTVDATISYYEVDGVRYCTLKTDAEGGIFLTDMELKFNWYLNVNYPEEGMQPLEIPTQLVGGEVETGEAGGPFPVAVKDYYWYWTDRGNDLGSFLDFVPNYGASYPLPYYDGNGGFFFRFPVTIEGSGYWYGFNDPAMVGIAEGFVRVDYTLMYESDYCTNGVVPITLGTGVDVKKVLLTAVEGKLNGAQVDKVIEGMSDGAENVITIPTDAFVYDADLEVYVGEYELGLDKTGEYTVILAALDEKDEIQTTENFVIEYVAVADEAENAVMISVGTEDVSDRYAPDYNKINSFAYWISGSDLVDVHVAVLPSNKVTQANLDKIKYGDTYAVSPEVLAEIQAAGGYATLATGLAPLTAYTVVVWATNGKLDTFEGATYTTDGLPNEEIGVGTYTYDGWWAGADDTQPLYTNPNYENTYVFENWGGGVDFTFVLNEDNTIYIPTFYIGADHANYGAVYYVDPYDWYSAASIEADPSKGEHSYYDPETKTYNFHFVLAVSAGSFGHFWESFILNADKPAEAPTLSSRSLIPFNVAPINNGKSNVFAKPEVRVERNPQPVQVSVKATDAKADSFGKAHNRPVLTKAEKEMKF